MVENRVYQEKEVDKGKNSETRKGKDKEKVKELDRK